MVEMPFDGEMYTLSLDFDHRQLDEILSMAPSNVPVFLKNELSTDPGTPRTIDFDGEVVFGVKARLGELQQVQNEKFVPFVTQKIM